MIQYDIAVSIEGVDTLNFGNKSMGGITSVDHIPHIGKNAVDYMDYDATNNTVKLKTDTTPSARVYELSNVVLKDAQVSGKSEMLSSQSANVTFAFSEAVAANDIILKEITHHNSIFEINCSELVHYYNTVSPAIDTLGLCFDPDVIVPFSFSEFTF